MITDVYQQSSYNYQKITHKNRGQNQNQNQEQHSNHRDDKKVSRANANIAHSPYAQTTRAIDKEVAKLVGLGVNLNLVV